MIDLSAKSKEQITRERKEAELRLAKRQEADAKRKRENHHKYMMGGVIHKYFKDCYCFDEDEWNRIIEKVFATREFTTVISAIREECAEKAKAEGSPGGNEPGDAAAGGNEKSTTVDEEAKNGKGRYYHRKEKTGEPESDGSFVEAPNFHGWKHHADDDSEEYGQ